MMKQRTALLNREDRMNGLHDSVYHSAPTGRISQACVRDGREVSVKVSSREDNTMDRKDLTFPTHCARRSAVRRRGRVAQPRRLTWLLRANGLCPTGSVSLVNKRIAVLDLRTAHRSYFTKALSHSGSAREEVLVIQQQRHVRRERRGNKSAVVANTALAPHPPTTLFLLLCLCARSEV
ncbi:hypothetical protein J6590_063024 [Homalodisca vitripennis]|nr:hypothetical protein J6590_063024 [Homalodisca vitripennis]